MVKLWPALLACGVLMLSSCTSTLNAITERPIAPDPGRTSIGTDIDDLQLDTLIGVNIKKASPLLELAHINVTVYNKVVLLTGEAPSEELRTLAGTTARAMRGVRQVHNELRVRSSSSVQERAKDGLLTTRVKVKLLLEKNVPASRIKVVTEGGVVYLMGLLRHDEANRAAIAAANARGATSVVKVFEYID